VTSYNISKNKDFSTEMPHGCTLNDQWLLDEDYSAWIMRTGDRNNARCGVCFKDIDLRSMGEYALKSHSKSDKHKNFLHRLRQNQTSQLVLHDSKRLVSSGQPSASVEICEKPGETQQKKLDESVNCTSVSSDSHKLSSFVTGSDTLACEIRWALRVCYTHQSYASVSGDNEILIDINC